MTRYKPFSQGPKITFRQRCRPRREQRDVSDHVALNIPQHRDVKLNELPKQIFMLLPLLLHWLYFLHSGEHANEAEEAAA